MADTWQLISDCYNRMLALLNLQLELVNGSVSDENLDEIHRIESDKQQLRTAIDELIKQNGYSLTEHQKQQLIQIIELLQLKTNQLQNQVTALYEENSKSMKQVSTHRKTLKAYGNIQNSDIVSFYFDEKK